MQSIAYAELQSSDLKKLILEKQSFVLIGIRGNIMDSISKVETEIESQGMKCRVTTDLKGTMAGAGAVGVLSAAVAAVPAAAAGAAFFMGSIIHSIATYNPDYEIVKDYINAKLTIKHKK